MMQMRWTFLGWLALAIGATVVIAQTAPQDAEAKYSADISRRADDIVAKLDITDASSKSRVKDLLVNHYRDLRNLDEGPNAQDKSEKRKSLHEEFLKKLSNELTPDQIEKVKDALTYNVMQITYKAYCDMIPNLTDAQKEKIRSYLTEAREQAMEGGSSKEKHEIFGKYKGKINVYLASEGYDLKKETKAWQDRLKARRAAASQPTSSHAD